MYNPTSAQNAFKSTSIAAIIAVLVSIVAGTYQYVLGHGLNIPALLLFIAPFVAGQAVTLWHVLTTNPKFPQAVTDTAVNLPAEIASLPADVAALDTKLNQFIASLMRQPAQTSVNANSQPAQVQQQPFPPLSPQQMAAQRAQQFTVPPFTMPVKSV